MAFTRKSLSEIGLEEDQIREVMRLHGLHMRDYTATADIEEQLRAAEEKGKNSVVPPTFNAEDSEEYKALKAEFTKYKTGRELVENYGVKSKFADAVAGRLDPEKETGEQIEAIRAEFEEYFVTQPTQIVQEEPKQTPVFGDAVKGEMPKGEKGTSFGDVWGFVPKR